MVQEKFPELKYMNFQIKKSTQCPAQEKKENSQKSLPNEIRKSKEKISEFIF